MSQMVHLTQLGDVFALPISIQAFEQYGQISEVLQSLEQTDNGHDIRSYVWGGTNYTAAKLYKFLFSQVECDQIIKSIWKSKCMHKLKVFLWLMFYDRLNTKDLMIRKHWHIEGGPNCILCSLGVLESRDHLFFDCPFALRCWSAVGLHWDTTDTILNRIKAAKEAFTGPCFLEIFACATWNIWKLRNEFIFQQMHPSFGRWRVKFQADLHPIIVYKVLMSNHSCCGLETFFDHQESSLRIC